MRGCLVLFPRLGDWVGGEGVASGFGCECLALAQSWLYRWHMAMKSGHKHHQCNPVTTATASTHSTDNRKRYNARKSRKSRNKARKTEKRCDKERMM